MPNPWDPTPVLVTVIVAVLVAAVLVTLGLYGSAFWTRPGAAPKPAPQAVAAIGYNSTNSTQPPQTETLTLAPTDVTRTVGYSAFNNCNLVIDTVGGKQVARVLVLEAAVYLLLIDAIVINTSSETTISLVPDIVINAIQVPVPSSTVPMDQTDCPTSQTKSLHLSYLVSLPVNSTVSVFLFSAVSATVTVVAWSLNLIQQRIC